MDKEDWKVSLKSLKKILKKKKDLLEVTIKNLNRDIEELEYTIECYEKRINELSDKPNK